MAKDPSKKGMRRVPPDVLDWVEQTYSKRVRDWYKAHVEAGRGEASRQRKYMSELAGKTGSFHEGHMVGAKDIDPDFGGGPTSGAAMRPQIGVQNVALGEKPRIPKADMRRAGIPQNWLEDFYEAVLEADGLKVIDGLDVQGAMAMDRGMSFEQASAQSRRRAERRAQGEDIPGGRFTGKRPAPIEAADLPQAQPAMPKIDTSKIKEGEGLPRISGASRRTVPDPDIPALLMKNGRALLSSRVGRALPVVGTALSAATVEMNRGARAAEIEANPDDPTLKANLALDELAGWADRVALGSAATGIGAPVAVGAEAVSTVASLTSLAIDGGRATLKAMQNREPYGAAEWQERLRARRGR